MPPYFLKLYQLPYLVGEMFCLFLSFRITETATWVPDLMLEMSITIGTFFMRDHLGVALSAEENRLLLIIFSCAVAKLNGFSNIDD